CRTCEKVVANIQNRWRHEKIHTKYKVQCDECSKSFTMKDNLKMHKQKFHGEAAFACNECGTMFSRKENLTRHKCGGSIAKATKRRGDDIVKVARKKRKQLLPKKIFDKLKRYVGGRLPGLFGLFLNGKVSNTKPIVHQRNVDAALNGMLEDLNSKLPLTKYVRVFSEPLEIDPGNFVLKYRAMEGYFMSFTKNFEDDDEEVFFEPDLLLEMYKVEYLNLLERCKKVLGDIRVNIYFTVRFAKAFDPTNQVTGHFSSAATVFQTREDLDDMIEK